MPQYEVWAFGSRAKWTAKPYSDLDLAIIADTPLSSGESAVLADDFSESDLPWKVDVVDWSVTTETFRQIIARDKVVIKRAFGKNPPSPHDWETHSLADIYEFSSGLSKPRSEFGSGYPFLSFKDVFYKSAVPTHLTELVNSTEQERIRCSVKRGDVFLTRTSETMDELGMSRVALADIPDATFNGFTKRLRPKEQRCIAPEFARYFFRSPKFRVALNMMASMSTRASLNNEMLERLTISFPSYEEQEEIGDILGTLDDKIELNRRMNETLEAMARAIFKDWFVDFGPVRAKAEGRQPPGLSPDIAALFPDALDDEDKPVGWEERRLEDVLELAYGKALKASERVDGAVPVYGSGGITGYHNEALVEGPSIIVGRKGTVGSLYWEDAPFFPIDTVFYVKPKAPLTFCFYHLQTLGLEGMNTDAAVPGLNRSNAYRLATPWPTDELLRAFDSIATPVRQKIRANVEESRTLTQLRDLLLPKLMSGEIRLKDAEKAVGKRL